MLTIFEGPDGGGKTTLAKRYAAVHDAIYVHFSELRGVENLVDVYLEAMLPALWGEQPVVFDRSWLSEKPYAAALRGGHCRITDREIEELENLALAVDGAVVLCLPPWDVVKANYLSRQEIEALANVDQLRGVYDAYACMETELPVLYWDYTQK